MGQIKAKIDGAFFEFDCEEDQNILEKALEEDIEVPFSCLSGSCNTCMAKLIKGNVDVGDDSFLEDEEREQGMILTCQACPRSDVVEIEFIESP